MPTSYRCPHSGTPAMYVQVVLCLAPGCHLLRERIPAYCDTQLTSMDQGTSVVYPDVLLVRPAERSYY